MKFWFKCEIYWKSFVKLEKIWSWLLKIILWVFYSLTIYRGSKQLVEIKNSRYRLTKKKSNQNVPVWGKNRVNPSVSRPAGWWPMVRKIAIVDFDRLLGRLSSNRKLCILVSRPVSRLMSTNKKHYKYCGRLIGQPTCMTWNIHKSMHIQLIGRSTSRTKITSSTDGWPVGRPRQPYFQNMFINTILKILFTIFC